MPRVTPHFSRAVLAVWVVIPFASSAQPAPAAAVDAAYRVTVIGGGQELLIEARLTRVPAALRMIAGAPRTLGTGWADFVRDVRLTLESGATVTLTQAGAGWTVEGAHAGPAVLRYRVLMQHDDTLPNGEPRWIRDRTMSEAAYRKSWGVFATAPPIFVLPNLLGTATLELVLPRGWTSATSWPSDGKQRYQLTGPNGFRPGLLIAGDITVLTDTIGGLSVQYAFGGAKMRAQSTRVERAVSRAMEYFVELMGGLPTADAGRVMTKTLVVLGEEERQHFIGGGLAGSNISMLEPPDGDWRMIEGVIAHELFHLWNGFSFRNMTAAESWFTEGVTEYYAFTALRAGGAITEKDWRASLASADSMYRADPGFGTMSIAAAGAQKFSHRGLTYGAGYVAAACLDADLRTRTGGRISLDQVMKAVFQRFNTTTRLYNTQSIEQLMSELSGFNYANWFSDHIDGLVALPPRACGVLS